MHLPRRIFFLQRVCDQDGVFSGLCSNRSFQLRHRTRLWNQSSVWSFLLTVGRGCSLMQIRTESPLDNCCRFFPSKQTQALFRASLGTWRANSFKRINTIHIITGLFIELRICQDSKTSLDCHTHERRYESARQGGKDKEYRTVYSKTKPYVLPSILAEPSLAK